VIVNWKKNESFVKILYKIISLKMKQKSVNKKDENQKF
jgi:hypothetical protein